MKIFFDYFLITNQAKFIACAEKNRLFEGVLKQKMNWIESLYLKLATHNKIT